MNISQKINHQDKIGTALRYSNPKRGWFGRKSSGKKLYIEAEALEYLLNLNDYDQLQVCKGIEALSSVSSPDDGMVNRQHPAFFKAKNATSTVFNFVIKYELTSNVVVVSAVFMNEAILGSKRRAKDERQSLYTVNKNGNAAFNQGSSLAQIKNLDQSWKVGQPAVDVKTEHAAVNGMLNNLTKAAWLMGTHTQHAYPGDTFDGFTLFHNPSEGGGLDFYESVRDNLGFTTKNAKHLAAVLADVQRKGKPVKWVVHSQGGIIFTQAIAHHIKNHSGMTLDKNTVVFHSGGNNKAKTEKLMSKVGIKKASPDKDNPFDLVPNLAGRNDLSLASIKRSLQFWSKVKGSEGSSTAESPHTLPFLGLDAYRRFLTLAGDNTSAQRVERYINGAVKPK